MLKEPFSIPKCMSTQHPDNVSSPFFAWKTVLAGDDEITEAYYAFSHLMCDEQMWDCEGKEVDLCVVKKLLTKYASFFLKEKLGEKRFITLRIPNPKIDFAEAKILSEALGSIPRSFDIAKIFYQKEIAPIFEVILPMASSAKSIERVYRYYKDFVCGKQDELCFENDIRISEWIGSFSPKTVNVIPLFEDRENMLNAHNVLREYLSNKDLPYQRVFFARSDPAMNYGMISALLLNKIALQRIFKLSDELAIPLYPILGVGSSPMRGRLTPLNVDNVLKEYPSVHTYTVQSAFKFDYPVPKVIEAVQKILTSQTSAPHELDEEKSLDIVHRMEKSFQKQVGVLSPLINRVANYIPKRRLRKQHVGLFGYSRNVGGVSLPRAITFTACLYSIGFPPELLGINILTKEDIQYLKTIYIYFEEDLRSVLSFYNAKSIYIPQEIKTFVSQLDIDYTINERHLEYTDQIIQRLESKLSGPNESIASCILEAAHIRHFLG